MSLKDLRENREIAEQLRTLLSMKRVVHAFMFAGGSAESRRSIGLEFAKAILCTDDAPDSCGKCLACRKFDSGNHEDLILVKKREDRASIIAEQVAELQGRVRFRPYGKTYAVVIEDAQLMNVQAQNKLLKLLEEPQADVVFILLVQSSSSMLSTVVSRCSCYYLNEDTADGSAEALKAAEKMTDLVLSGGLYFEKRDCLSYILKNKEDPRALALEFIASFEDALAVKAAALALGGKKEQALTLAEAAKACVRAGECLEQAQNTAYTLKQLCLSI